MATEKISTVIIADDAVTGDKIENNPTVAGNLTVSGNTTLSGTNNLGSNPTVTLGTNTTFPTKVTDRDYWYPIGESGSTAERVGAYLASGTLDNSYGVTSGCAPKGFTSVEAIKSYFISSSSGPSSWTPIGVRFEIGSDGNAKSQHAAEYNITTSGAFGNNTIRAVDLFNAQDNGSDFEDLVSENDIFGWRFLLPSMNQVLYGLGVKITWRF
tara:strand:- start:409 stop:1044 length:636 start_codon:yes stop_codon:yes gene_type:complete